MSVDSLYTGTDAKTAVKRVRIAGTTLPTVLSVEWSFAIGRVPTATVKVPNPPPVTAEYFADVVIEVGFNGLYERVFTGKVLDVNRSETEATIMCTGMSQFLDRTSDDVTEITILNKTNIEVLEYLFGLAGIDYYTIALPSWTMGTAESLHLSFSSFAEAITKVAEIDGGRWAELPSGQIRVAVYDPIPSVQVARTYFSMELTALAEAYPAGIVAGDGRPRIRQAEVSHRTGDVKNRIKVRGATVTETIGEWEVSDDIDWKLEGESDYVRNPDGSQAYADLLFSNDLIDTYDKAEEVAIRLLAVWNRLPDLLAMTVEGDPMLALGSSIRVEDPRYSGASGRFFLESYQTTLSSGDFSTQLNGVGEGATSDLDPVAQITYCQAMHVVINDRMYIVMSFDGRSSFDPDGTIAGYSWSDNKGLVAGTDPVVSVRVDPDVLGAGATWQVTLTVTDNDGNADSATVEPTTSIDECTDECVTRPPLFAALEIAQSGSPDAGLHWYDRADTGVQAVAAPVGDDLTKMGMALYGTSDGNILRTVDFCYSALTTVFSPGGSIVDIRWEPGKDVVYALSRTGQIYRSASNGASGTWALWANLRNDLGKPNALFNRLYFLAGGEILFVCGGTRDTPGQPIVAYLAPGGGWTLAAIGGELQTDLSGAPSDVEAKDIAMNELGKLAMILASATFTPAVYYTEAVFGGGGEWKRCTGLPAKSQGRWIQGCSEESKFMFAYGDNALYMGDVTAGVMTCTAAAGALDAGDVSNTAFWAGDPFYGVPGLGDVYIISGEGTANGTLYITWNRGANVGKVRPATGYDAPPVNANAKMAAIGTTPPCPELYAQEEGSTKQTMALNALVWESQSVDVPSGNENWHLQQFHGHLFRIGECWGAPGEAPGQPGNIERSTDYGQTWQTVLAGEQLIDGINAGTMCMTKAADGTLWAAWWMNWALASALRVYKSTDQGATWQQVSTGYETINPTFRAVDITAHPNDANRVVITCDGAGAGGTDRIIYTTNGGTNWSHYVLPFAGAFGWGCRVHYGDGGRLVYVGPSTTYSSDDGGATWTQRDDITGYAGSRFVNWLLPLPPRRQRLLYCFRRIAAGQAPWVIRASVDNGQSWYELANAFDLNPSIGAGCWSACLLADGSLVIGHRPNMTLGGVFMTVWRCPNPWAASLTWENWSYNWNTICSGHLGMQGLASIYQEGPF